MSLILTNSICLFVHFNSKVYSCCCKKKKDSKEKTEQDWNQGPSTPKNIVTKNNDSSEVASVAKEKK